MEDVTFCWWMALAQNWASAGVQHRELKGKMATANLTGVSSFENSRSMLQYVALRQAWDIEEEAVKIGFAHGISVRMQIFTATALTDTDRAESH